MAVRYAGVRGLVVALVLTIVLLAGCAPGVGGSHSLTIGSKNDADGQLLASMYALLLKQKGYTVTERLALGQTNVLDAALKSGAIDIYPEFTGTALSLLNLPTTQDAHVAYRQVRDAYHSQFRITWLEPAYNLNDGYAVCTARAIADQYHLRSLEDLAPIAGQLTVAQQEDAAPVLAPVQTIYGIRFKGAIYMSEPKSFGAVQQGLAQVNVCYATEPAIQANDFVILSDPRNAFPVYNPAPLVRNQVLEQSPDIASTLAPLAAQLSTDSMSVLIKRVNVDHQPVEDVAREFLQTAGLLPPS